MATMVFIKGKLTFNKPIDKDFLAKFKDYTETNHCLKNIELIKQKYPHWKEMTLLGDGNLGRDGEFFVCKQDFNAPNNGRDDEIIVDLNHGYAASRYANWLINDDGTELVPLHIEKDGGWIDNPQGYLDELFYLCQKVFAPLGYILNGECQCDEPGYGTLNVVIINNLVFCGSSTLNGFYYGSFTIDSNIRMYNDEARKEILKDRDLAFKLLKLKCISILDFNLPYRDDRDFVLQSLINLEGNRYADRLALIPREYRDDEEIMTAAIKASPKFINGLGDKLSNDKAFIKKAITNNPGVMVYLKKTKWADDEELYNLVLKLNKKYVKYFSIKK